MKKTAAPITIVLLFAVAFSARAQETTHFSSTSAPGARIESQVTALSEPAAILAPEACTANATTLCLNNSRFQVRVTFSVPTQGITNAPAQAVPLTGDTGYFWFFSANNVEITLKVVDGRAFNGFFWAFYAALSDVAYTITITDMDTGNVKTYSNSQGSLASVADVTAFSGGSCSYTVSAANPASFGSGGGTGTVSVAAGAGCTWSAASNSSFVTITSGSSGSGNGTVSFSVAANSSTTARSGSLTVAGQSVSISQSGTTSGGNFDGSWTGPTSQGRTVSFTISGNALTNFTIVFPLTGSCTQGSLGVIFSTPRALTGNTFTFTSTSSLGSLTASGTLTSNTTGNGTANYTLNPTAPSFCSGSGSPTWTAMRP